MGKPPTNRHSLNDAKRLLASAPLIAGACELDVLVFLHRHPRTLLTIEQLATFVGYDMKKVAKAIDAFIDAGLLERAQNRTHAARMYLLILDGPSGGGLTALLKSASTRQGRQDLLQVLSTKQSQAVSTTIVPEGRRLHAIA